MTFDDLGKSIARSHRRKGIVEGAGFRFYARSCLKMTQCQDETVALTVTSPPYWNSIDYDIHTRDPEAWHREREYGGFGATFRGWLTNIE